MSSECRYVSIIHVVFFRNDKSGFVLSHMKTWQQLRTGQPYRWTGHSDDDGLCPWAATLQSFSVNRRTGCQNKLPQTCFTSVGRQTITTVPQFIFQQLCGHSITAMEFLIQFIVAVHRSDFHRLWWCGDPHQVL